MSWILPIADALMSTISFPAKLRDQMAGWPLGLRVLAAMAFTIVAFAFSLTAALVIVVIGHVILAILQAP